MRFSVVRLGTAGLLAATAAFLMLGNAASGVDLGAPAPELKGGPWLNSEPLQIKDLRGKVVLIKMWTFG